MPSFGKRSMSNLETCHPDLQRLFKEVIKHYDCAVIQGYRNKEEQNRYFFEGRSKLKFPNSKHNSFPSGAIDVIPYPVSWSDKNRFYYFIGLVMGIASQLNIKIRSGGDWDRDNDLHDQAFFDLPHFELI